MPVDQILQSDDTDSSVSISRCISIMMVWSELSVVSDGRKKLWYQSMLQICLLEKKKLVTIATWWALYKLMAHLCPQNDLEPAQVRQ